MPRQHATPHPPHQIPRARVHAHVLPAAGGASGVGESLCEFVRARRIDMVALGSRGLGSFQR